MDDTTILAKVKTTLRVVTDDFDEEITDLIAAAQSDLATAGIIVSDPLDDLCLMAIKTFCRMNFGNPDNYERLKASYDEQKAQLSMRTGYTRWVNG